MHVAELDVTNGRLWIINKMYTMNERAIFKIRCGSFQNRDVSVRLAPAFKKTIPNFEKIDLQDKVSATQYQNYPKINELKI